MCIVCCDCEKYDESNSDCYHRCYPSHFAVVVEMRCLSFLPYAYDTSDTYSGPTLYWMYCESCCCASLRILFTAALHSATVSNEYVDCCTSVVAVCAITDVKMIVKIVIVFPLVLNFVVEAEFFSVLLFHILLPFQE